MNTISLKCTAGPGMFPHESGILIKGADRYYETMVDSEFLKLNADAKDTAWIDVGVVQVNGTNVLIELPRQVVAGGRRIWVPESEVDAHGHPLAACD